MDVRDFDFDLPPELIAQEPPPDRGAARLLVLDRASGSLTHTRVTALPDLLRAGDLLVVNDTRVFPARLLGRRVPSGGAVECLLIGRCRSRTGAGPEAGSRTTAGVGGAGASRAETEAGRAGGVRRRFDTLHGEVLERRFFGRRLIRLWTDGRDAGRRRHRCDRPRAAAAVHQARRPRGRSRALPDRLRARARVDRGADRRPAFHAGAARRR